MSSAEEPAQTIDQVIDRITGVTDWAIQNNSRLGYFAALYRKVTLEVKQGIAGGFFDDGPRMERLDVIFANRYLDAFRAWSANRRTTASWSAAFVAGGAFWPIVLQHLLLGMNAHINLDLGIAAAQTVPGSEVEDLHGDFNRINEILGRLTGEVQEELAAVWPLLRIFNRHLGHVDDKIVNFSMKAARNHAWSVAQKLAHSSQPQKEIAQLDGRVVQLARAIRKPGVVLGTVTKIVRLGERKSIPEVIRILL